MATRRAVSRVEGGAVASPRAIAAESTLGARAALLGKRLAGPALAFSLNGFFVYLGVLDLAGVAPRTATTGVYYGGLGAVLTVLVWANRQTLVAHARAGGRVLAVFALAAGALAVWFELNAALVSEGSLSRRLAAQLLFWTVPTVLLALSLTRRQLEDALWAILALGLTFVAIDAVALAVDPHGDPLGDRFSPIAELDPITAAQVPALAAVACLALRPERASLRRGRLLALPVLVAFAVAPGSRGPLAALALAALAMLWLSWRTTGPRVGAGLALGAVAGTLLAAGVGSTSHLTSGGAADGGETGRISSLHIRQQLWSKSLRAVPDEPLVGNGVGALVDDTPEARRMGIAGRHTYPHNTFLEAAYSLGVPGLLLFVSAIAAGAWALVRVRRAGGGVLPDFTAALFLFALVNSNLTNALGTDVWLWTAAAVSVSLLAMRRLEAGQAARAPDSR